MKEINHVYETNDYSMFKTLDGNRNLQQLHVRRLVRSFGEAYLFSPIIINEHNEVIDGQHRLCAAKELELPIRFIICKGYGLPEIQRLNTNMKNWKHIDYLDAYCDLKYPEYLRFRDFMHTYPDFGIASAMVLLTQVLGNVKDATLDYRGMSGKPTTSQFFEEGKLKIPDYKISCEYAEKILLLKSYFEGFNTRIFVIAMVGLFKYSIFSISELIAKLKFNPGGLQSCVTVMQYRLLIEDIYNYRRREKVNLRY